MQVAAPLPPALPDLDKTKRAPPRISCGNDYLRVQKPGKVDRPMTAPPNKKLDRKSLQGEKGREAKGLDGMKVGQGTHYIAYRLMMPHFKERQKCHHNRSFLRNTFGNVVILCECLSYMHCTANATHTRERSRAHVKTSLCCGVRDRNYCSCESCPSGAASFTQPPLPQLTRV